MTTDHDLDSGTFSPEDESDNPRMADGGQAEHAAPYLPKNAKRADDEPGDPFEESSFHEKPVHEAGWREIMSALKLHPFMKLFHSCATSMYIDLPRGERMRHFTEHHRFFLRCCIVFDMILDIVVCVLLIELICIALRRIVGPQGCGCLL